MLKAMRISLAAAIVACLATPAAAKGPIRKLKVGNWTGGSFTNDTTGRFTHCGAWASYVSGITFFVVVDHQMQWKLGFSHKAWRMTPGQSIPIALTFDGRGPVQVTGTAQSSTFAVVPMPVNSALIRAFRAASGMQAYAEGNRYTFKLDDTSRLLPALVDCVRQEGDQPGVAAAPPAPAPAAPPLSPEVQAERNRLINEAAGVHVACMRDQMKQLVPYSNESAEILAQVVVTKCAEAEKKFVSLGIAMFGASRETVERLVTQRLDRQKKEMIADIVTFRAELSKAQSSKPKPPAPAAKPADIGI
ncbi:MAG: trypsin-like serine protease with C-terminal domain containing [Hyphomicrobiales bacterium]|jgi:hypothetical protein|nr:trypsin-like serine protease with C-terminal domain containing [Hyphomicrobiales bacterium]